MCSMCNIMHNINYNVLFYFCQSRSNLNLKMLQTAILRGKNLLDELWVGVKK